MMPPQEAEQQARRARDRFAVIAGLRAGGVALMLIGVWGFLGGSLGGIYHFGEVLFVVGAIDAFAIPALLARRWKAKP